MEVIGIGEDYIGPGSLAPLKTELGILMFMVVVVMPLSNWTTITPPFFQRAHALQGQVLYRGGGLRFSNRCNRVSKVGRIILAVSGVASIKGASSSSFLFAISPFCLRQMTEQPFLLRQRRWMFLLFLVVGCGLLEESNDEVVVLVSVF